MAKKTFISDDNPALQFISSAHPVEEEAETVKPCEAQSAGEPLARLYSSVARERRSQRVQLVLQPTLYDRLKAKAAEQGISFNEFCIRVFEETISK